MTKIINFLIITLFFTLKALTFASEWQNFEHSKIRAIQENNNVVIEIELKDEFITFSDIKGDFGQPPQIQVSGKNIDNYKIIYPTPLEYKKGDFTSYIYKDKVKIPIILNLKSTNITSNIDIDITYTLCNNSCHIANAHFNLDINANDTEQSKSSITENHINNSQYFRLILNLLYAFIGGIILNFMPCILPILSLKLISFSSIRNDDLHETKTKIFATIFGIISCFFIIAITTIILKHLGKKIGFGLHFQEPIFLITIIIILTLVACNLIGSFEINSPNFINNKLNNFKIKNHILSSFFTGFLTTILATPCTAPFLTLAISYAMTASNPEIIMIFIFMGLGLSFPYFLLIINPKLIQYIPKPGKWMINFKKILGLLIFATALWFINILKNHIGVNAAIIIFLLCIILKFILSNQSRNLIFTSLKIIALLIVIFLFYYLPLFIKKENTNHEIAISEFWENFDESKISHYITENKIILVDITAEWCITCKFNKYLNFSTIDQLNFYKKNNVIGLQADVTKDIPQNIYNFMKSHNRYGIPLNIIYSKTNPNGLILNEILLPNELKKIILSQNKPQQNIANQKKSNK